MPDYANVLNSAQLEAVSSSDQVVLVVAGAGTGKTRVIVHRLAWLVEHGISPRGILLLTFTRKAAQEMMTRADALVSQGMEGVTGGTFHSFAYGALRRFRPDWLEGRPFSIMDSEDITAGVRLCREQALGGKKDSSFPKTQTIAALMSKARNKEIFLTDVLRKDNFHLLAHAEALEKTAVLYQAYKREKGLLDYDDLLFELEALLAANGHAARELRARYGHILVDEYQDTNLVQARIVRLLAGPMPGPDEGPALVSNVMAVGDEAQSIYAFRGANVRNILDFPRLFPNTRIVRLEENYRSTQPILNVANNILLHSAESFRKELFTRKSGGGCPRLVVPLSDFSEAQLVSRRIEELLDDYRPEEIAVLFRSGFHSFPLENALRQRQIPFRKYGGLRFVEAAHIKDVISFARLAINPLDFPSFSRIAAMHAGIGPKTAQKLYDAARNKDETARKKAFKRFADFAADLDFIALLSAQNLSPGRFFENLLEHYRPRLEQRYADDWPGRAAELESLGNLASTYHDLELLVADLSLETPEEHSAGSGEQITLSTIHSAKGLEWKAVILLDLVEDRFPSRHAQLTPEDFEEERRLFYVACTRAREKLEIYAPATIYNRSFQGHEPVAQSPFVRELPAALLQKSYESSTGSLATASPRRPGAQPPAVDYDSQIEPEDEPLPKRAPKPAPKLEPLRGRATGYCRHKLFGRGKIVEWTGDDKARVKFPGYGEKTILADYLFPEE